MHLRTSFKKEKAWTFAFDSLAFGAGFGLAPDADSFFDVDAAALGVVAVLTFFRFLFYRANQCETCVPSLALCDKTTTQR